MILKHDTRRTFVEKAALLLPALAALRLSAEEPFDALPASAWKRARNNGLVMIHRPAPRNLSWQARIVQPSEPGDPLTVSGCVYAPDGISTVPDVTVYAYNTDAAGYYGEHRAEYPPRIYGWMRTGADGRFELRTIHPGCYPDKQIPAHIHFSFWGGGYPLQWTEELRFEGERYVTPELLAEDARLGDFRTIQRLTRGSDGALHCSVRIRLQRETNFV